MYSLPAVVSVDTNREPCRTTQWPALDCKEMEHDGKKKKKKKAKRTQSASDSSVTAVTPPVHTKNAFSTYMKPNEPIIRRWQFAIYTAVQHEQRIFQEQLVSQPKERQKATPDLASLHTRPD